MNELDSATFTPLCGDFGRTPREAWQAYERVDKPRGEFFHTNWTGRGDTTTARTYTV